MADEQFTLNGVEFHDGLPFFLNALDLTPPTKTLQWAKAAAQDGATLIQPPFHELRQIKATVQVKPQTTMDAALDAIGTLVDQLQLAEQTAAGGTSKGLPAVYVPAGSTYTYTFYVKAGEVTGLPNTIDQGWLVKAPIFEVTLYCDPAAYGAEITSTTTTAATPIVEKTLTAIPGDLAAEGRLLVVDNATQARDLTQWGHDKDTGSTLIVAGSLLTAGFAGSATTRAGAYLSNTVEASCSYALQVIAGTGDLPHVGTYRVLARVMNPGTDFGLRFRFDYRVGRDPFSSSGYATPSADGKWCEVDFGTITIPAVQVGTQTWEGRILGQYTSGGNNTGAVNYLMLIPVTKGYGKARVPAVLSTGAEVASAHDEFGQTAGTLSGKTAVQGGNWTTSGGAADFQTLGSPLFGVFHQSAGDRLATLNSTVIAGTAAYVDYTCTAPADTGATHIAGVVARRISATQFVLAGIKFGGGNPTIAFLAKNPALSGVIAPNASVPFSFTPGQTYRIGIVVSPTGWAALFINGGLVAAMYDVDFITAGTLATGSAGFYIWGNGSADTKYFDNFAAWVPAVDHVTNSTRTTEFRASGDPCVRADSTGVYYGRPADYNGSRFWLSTGTSRVAVKSRRYDTDELPDEFVTDSTSISVKYRPRWIVIPRTA